MSIKPSELLPSVHAYLSTRYPKAAKALQKEALLAAPARDAVVPLEAAAAAWSRRQARRGLDGAADLPRAVHSFLADCKLERAAKALRKEGRLRGAASPAAPLLEMARLHARRAARGSAQIRLRATPRAVWAHPTHWLIRTQARRAARRGGGGGGGRRGAGEGKEAAGGGRRRRGGAAEEEEAAGPGASEEPRAAEGARGGRRGRAPRGGRRGRGVGRAAGRGAGAGGGAGQEEGAARAGPPVRARRQRAVARGHKRRAAQGQLVRGHVRRRRLGRAGVREARQGSRQGLPPREDEEEARRLPRRRRRPRLELDQVRRLGRRRLSLRRSRDVHPAPGPLGEGPEAHEGRVERAADLDVVGGDPLRRADARGVVGLAEGAVGVAPRRDVVRGLMVEA